MALPGPRALIARSLLHYWRVNAAVAAGAAIAVAVLAGALLVGGSVRESLRRLALERLGRTEIVLAANAYFREELAEEMARQSPFCPLIRLEALAVHPESGRRAGGVAVYGVDSRFWKFHRSTPEAAPEGRTVRLSPALAAELGVAEGDGVLLRFESHSDIPRESLHGRKANASRTVRLAAGKALPPEALGEFSLAPSQGAVRAAFVPLERLRRELEQPGKVNTALFAGAAATRLRDALRDRFTLADAGIRVRVLEPPRRLSLESASLILDDALAAAARKAAASLGLTVEPVFTYLANTIRVGDRTVPYSLAAALPLEGVGLTGLPADAIVLNEWTARELNARPGATVTLEYFLWRPSGGLETKTAAFRLAAVVPIRGLAADRDLAPEYPGITEAENLSDWDPPFPLELSRIRSRDEDYWERYRTTPKAFLSVERGRELWGSRFGSVTALRLAPPAGVPLEEARRQFHAVLRPLVDPLASGFTLVDVRAQAEEASRGATDFGEYFLYFSFFLVVSALLLAGLFFRLGVEQRLGEIGLLRSVGYPPALIRRLFLGEGVALAAVGCAFGLPGAVLYGAFILHGLRTWWVDAVGTRLIELHVSPAGLAAGAIGGLAVAAVVIALTLRGLARHSPRALLRGGALEAAAAAPRGLRPAAWTAGVAAMAAVGGSGLGWIPAAAGFFLGGTLLLAAFLCAVRWLLARPWGTNEPAAHPGTSLWIAVGAALLAIGAAAFSLIPPAAGYSLGGVLLVVALLSAVRRGSASGEHASPIQSRARQQAAFSLFPQLAAWITVGAALVAVGAAAFSLIPPAAGYSLGGVLLVVALLSAVRRGSASGEHASPIRSRARQQAAFSLFPQLAAWITVGAALVAVGAAAFSLIPPAVGYSLGGVLLAIALLSAVRSLLARPWGAADSLFRLGARGAAYRPNRSTLAIALIASATFLIAALSAFRQDGSGPGAGGYSLFAESLLPIYYDLNTSAGREDLPLAPDESAALDGVRVAAFRLRPGDEASCLNLYRPRNPRILAPPREWAAAGARFPFAASLAGTPAERANPWLLLDRLFPDGAVPAIADANSLAYVLHKKVGEDFAIEREGAPPIRLRFVAALAGSLFQSELLVSEQNFVRLFPREEGFRFFLLEAPRGKEQGAAAALERALRDFGFDAAPTADRLAAYHRVENTYLATFQTLGAFGLLLGTAGLAAVLLRNVLERRKELALLAAAGYRKRDLSRLVLAENLLLLGAGLSGGTVAALVAIAPAVAARGGGLPTALLAGVIAGVFGVGLLASLAAVRVVRRGNLLAALRSE